MNMCGDPNGPGCEEVLQQLYIFIDDELAPAEAQQIRSHIDNCVGCSAEQRVETVVKMLVQKGCRETAPEALKHRVLVAIRETRVETHFE